LFRVSLDQQCTWDSEKAEERKEENKAKEQEKESDADEPACANTIEDAAGEAVPSCSLDTAGDSPFGGFSPFPATSSLADRVELVCVFPLYLSPSAPPAILI
jgi:hypothetical protein